MGFSLAGSIVGVTLILIGLYLIGVVLTWLTARRSLMTGEEIICCHLKGRPMAFSLTFETDNAAFEEDKGEVTRILRDIATKIDNDDGLGGGFVFDSNGNRIGKWSWDRPEPNDD